MINGVLIILGLLDVYSMATTQNDGNFAQPSAISQSSSAVLLDRDALLSQLGPEEQRKVEEFESRVTWLS
jgi:hypothetical protein